MLEPLSVACCFPGCKPGGGLERRVGVRLDGAKGAQKLRTLAGFITDLLAVLGSVFAVLCGSI